MEEMVKTTIGCDKYGEIKSGCRWLKDLTTPVGSR